MIYIQILRNSKAYKVLVPIFKKLEKEGKPEVEEKEDTLCYFKIGNVFDISQTNEDENYLKEQKEIDEKIMKNREIDYNIANSFVSKNFPKIKIKENFKAQEEKGSYNPLSHKIILYQKSSHTLFHELGHYITVSVLKLAGHIRKDEAKNEILAGRSLTYSLKNLMRLLIIISLIAMYGLTE